MRTTSHDTCDITMSLTTNWGHPKRIGMTEVEFLDPQGEQVPVNKSNIWAVGVQNPKGHITNLINRQMMTTREDQMWSCDLPEGGDPVTLSFKFGSPSSSKAHHLPSMMRVWNYNSEELNVGAKRIQVVVNGTSVYDGDIRKGCNNSNVNYSQTISLQQKDTTQKGNTGMKKPAALNLTVPSNADSLYVPSFHTPTLGRRSQQSSPKRTTATRGRSASIPGDHVELVQFPQNPQVRLTNSTFVFPTTYENGKSCTEATDSTSSSSSGSNSVFPASPPSETSSSSSLKLSVTVASPASPTSPKQKSPGWLRSTDKVNDKERTSSEGDSFPTPTSRRSMQRPYSEKLSRRPHWFQELEPNEGLSLQQQKSFWRNNFEDKRTTSISPDLLSLSGSTGGDSPSRPSSHLSLESVNYSQHSGSPTPRLEDVLTELMPKETKDRETSARFGRRAMLSPKQGGAAVESSYLPSQRVRPKRRRQSDINLEEGWSSLNAFDHMHRGRIGTALNAERDILDTYMLQEKLKKQQAAQKNSNHVNDGPVEADTNEILDRFDTDFIIPELPEGQHLTVNIRTTWGDKHYVGLNGIEVFCNTGELAQVSKIWADPSDINVLPEYQNDPRVVANLIDGVNRTRDDMHLWLAPFSQGNNHYIYISFHKVVKVAMIRIWNYNKSRIHSYRGARHVEMTLDGKAIFLGEIIRACGEVQGGIEDFGDTILFTTDDAILEAISHHDKAFMESLEASPFSFVEEVIERPKTTDSGFPDERPHTTASTVKKNVENKYSSPYSSGSKVTKGFGHSGQCLVLSLVANWGDPEFIGLTGLELIGEGDEPIPLLEDMLVSSYESHSGSLANLVNSNNLTTLESDAWLVPYSDKIPPTLTITLTTPALITGLRLWNYNGLLENTYKGVKVLLAILDGKFISPLEGFLVRKGPGNCHFEYAQYLAFSPASNCGFSHVLRSPSARSLSSSSSEAESLEEETPVMPQGFIFQLQLLSTWGDPYYIGLNGIEIYDSIGKKISLTENNIAAYPDSVNVLDVIDNDVRTPDKLIDGVNDTTDGSHVWLAPILPGVLNRVYVIFDSPVMISMIKLWNYSKTPCRGVKEFGILVDDLLIYNGTLAKRQAGLNSGSSKTYQTVLFTTDADVIDREKDTIIKNQDEDNEVELTNEVQGPLKPRQQLADQALRPATSVTPTELAKSRVLARPR